MLPLLTAQGKDSHITLDSAFLPGPNIGWHAQGHATATLDSALLPSTG